MPYKDPAQQRARNQRVWKLLTPEQRQERSQKEVARRKAKSAEWKAQYRQKTRVANRKWKQSHDRAWKLWSKYGLTIETFNKIRDEQDGRCAICHRRPDHTLHVDHCHKTGRVRGLLCRPCNTALGLLGDSLEILDSAKAYLTQ